MTRPQETYWLWAPALMAALCLPPSLRAEDDLGTPVAAPDMGPVDMPQLGYALRHLEMKLQRGLGCAHGLVGIFEVDKT